MAESLYASDSDCKLGLESSNVSQNDRKTSKNDTSVELTSGRTNPPSASESEPLGRVNLAASNSDSEIRVDKTSAEEQDDETTKLSKRQKRKLKKQEKWLIYKPQKRAKEKEKKRQRRQDAIARGEDMGPSRKRLKLNTMAKSNCRVSVAIDCSLDSYMLDRDIMKLSQQIQFSYSTNRRADNPIQLYICGITGQVKSRLDRIGDYKNWDVHSSQKDYLQLFDKSQVVYLSSDSSNVLHDLESEKVYIIGGLVDHNHYKGLCHKLAEEKGVSHARLPISEYIDLKSRKVLTINHVFEILLKYTETKDWRQAFFSVLPQRKGAQVKTEQDESADILSQGRSCDEETESAIDCVSQGDLCDEKNDSAIDSVGQGHLCDQGQGEEHEETFVQETDGKEVATEERTKEKTNVESDDIRDCRKSLDSHDITGS